MFLRALFALIVALFAVAAPAQFLSSDPADRLSSVPHDPAMQQAIRDAGLDMVVVNHEGWRETFVSFSRLKVYQVTGRTRIKGQDPVYTTLSMMFEPQKWYPARILPVEHPDLLQRLSLDGKWVSPQAVINSPGLSALQDELRDGAALKKQLDDVTNLLNAVEQTSRLGREPHVVESFREKGITPDQVLALVDDPEALRKQFDLRSELAEKHNRIQPFLTAGEKLINRARVLAQLSNELLIVPDMDSVDERWVRPLLAAGNTAKTMAAGRAFEEALAQAFVLNKPDLLAPATQRFLDVVEQSRAYPSRSVREVNNRYVTMNPWRLAAGLYLLGVSVLGMFFFFRSRLLYRAAMGLLAAGFLFHTAAILMRLYLTGHAPVSNMFESITFCSWAVMVIAVAFEAWNRRGLVALGAMTMGFLLLTGASLMPLHETRIHPLRAVLNSYWLNIHVTLMLLSYAAFAIAAFFSVVYLLRSFRGQQATRAAQITGLAAVLLAGLYWGLYALNPAATIDSVLSLARNLIFALAGIAGLAAALLGLTIGLRAIRRTSMEDVLPLAQTEEFAYRLVQVGWPILTFGITLGAIWADTAWGRYWGWDPKETWAFITWVAYTVYLHSRMVMGWRGRWSAAACVAGFIMVMITWWGVSYLPWFSGGLHSYASPR